MTNPFERTDIEHRVLVNGEDAHCLWPAFLDVPAGWRVVFGPAGREDCLVFIDRHWTGLQLR